MRTSATQPGRDHGGNLDAAMRSFGGARSDWVDLSTGINPASFPLPPISPLSWTQLPDARANAALLDAARAFWCVPDGAEILAASGASALIAAAPSLFSGTRVTIPAPTYNEHAAAFSAQGWQVVQSGPSDLHVIVHPNNPDGRLWSKSDTEHSTIIIDESFADILPDHSLIARAAQPGGLVLKSFGKFWGLAGLRLGFAIGAPELIAVLRDRIGPWAVSGPALEIATAALRDTAWADETRLRLAADADRLDDLMLNTGATPIGGTSLFRLYDTQDAKAFQDKLARHHIWSRIFPYSDRWLRLGLPAPTDWPRVETALHGS